MSKEDAHPWKLHFHFYFLPTNFKGLFFSNPIAAA